MRTVSKSHIVLAGALVGILSFLMMILDYYSIGHFGLPLHPVETKIMMLLLAISPYLVLRSRKSTTEKAWNFTADLRELILVSIIAGLVWASLSATFVMLTPAYKITMLKVVAQEVSSPDMASESVGRRLAGEILYSPLGQFVSKLLISTVWGGLMSIIALLILRIQRPRT
jgi:hypothetical protein